MDHPKAVITLRDGKFEDIVYAGVDHLSVVIIDLGKDAPLENFAETYDGEFDFSTGPLSCRFAFWPSPPSYDAWIKHVHEVADAQGDDDDG